MENVKNIKCVLFDFDDTLAIHKRYTRSDEEGKILYFSNVMTGKFNWETSGVSKHMKLFMDYCNNNNIRMCLISSSSAIEAERKLKWVEANYGYKLENCCVISNEQKILVARAIAKVYDLNLKEILVVDDAHSVLSDAEIVGLQASSPMEIVDFIENINFYINKIVEQEFKK